MPTLADFSSPDVLNRLPAPARAAIEACMAELVALDLENRPIMLACLLAEFQLAERRAAARRWLH
jgi:hypothetical protein